MMIDLQPGFDTPFDGIDEAAVADLGPIERGKVRDIVDLGDRLAIVATDRLSAFDRIIGTVPYRGQVLNELAAWWFDRIGDIVDSHVLSIPDPNVTLAMRCHTLPVEVVVRGHLSGSTSTSLWTKYAAGQRSIYGHRFPEGMAKNDALPTAIITPTTKADLGAHDEPITEAQIVERGLVSADRWDEVRSAALAVFATGQAVAAASGLVLVDTKYEFGIDGDDGLRIIDEVHTPDSSRYWRAGTVAERLAAGFEPENLDKEVVRLTYAERGYRGESDPPPLDRDLAETAARAYLETFVCLTGEPLIPAPYPASDRVVEALRAIRR